MKVHPADQGMPIGAILGWSNNDFAPASTSAIIAPSQDGVIALTNFSDSSITITPTIEGWFAGAPPAPTTTLSGYARYADGSAIPGAQVLLSIEEPATNMPASGTVGKLIGPVTTSSSGFWTVNLNGIPDDAIRNPDGSIILDGEVTSADATYDKLFNLNFVPSAWQAPGEISEVGDADLRTTGGGPLNAIQFSMAGVDATSATVPNSLTPIETDYSTELDAYNAARAPDSHCALGLP